MVRNISDAELAHFLCLDFISSLQNSITCSGRTLISYMAWPAAQRNGDTRAMFGWLFSVCASLEFRLRYWLFGFEVDDRR